MIALTAGDTEHYGTIFVAIAQLLLDVLIREEWYQQDLPYSLESPHSSTNQDRINEWNNITYGALDLDKLGEPTKYSDTCLERPPLLSRKCGLSNRWSFHTVSIDSNGRRNNGKWS